MLMLCTTLAIATLGSAAVPPPKFAGDFYMGEARWRYYMNMNMCIKTL